MSGSDVDGCESQIVKQGDVRVRRSVVPAEDGDLSVKFSVESDRDRAVAVRITDSNVAADDIDIDPNEGNCQWTADEGKVSFSRSIVSGDSFVIAYRVSDGDRADVAGTPPTIEAIQPIDERDARAGVVPQWRGNGPGAGASVALAGGGGETAVRATASDVRTIGEREATTNEANGRRNSDASIGCLVAIPAYNEAGSIAGVISRTEPHADEVLVVDDGSSDDTATRAREAGATVIQHDYNKGYGGALKTAFVESKRQNVSHLVIIDGDGQHDPADIPQLVAHQRASKADIVIGSRFTGRRRSDIPPYRRFGLWIINVLTNASMGIVRSESWIGDTQSGFRAYGERAIDSLATDSAIGQGMNASTDILYHSQRRRYEIDEIDTVVSYDVENASSQNAISHGLDLVSNILQTIERDHPISSLGLPGVIGTFIGLLFAYWTIFDYVRFEVFPLGLAMTSVFFTLAGVFACFTAIVLHSLNTHLSGWRSANGQQ
jgi:glycosyltransferase involved in cell wall biosynthesis